MFHSNVVVVVCSFILPTLHSYRFLLSCTQCHVSVHLLTFFNYQILIIYFKYCYIFISDTHPQIVCQR